jgi:hypothetical protein
MRDEIERDRNWKLDETDSVRFTGAMKRAPDIASPIRNDARLAGVALSSRRSFDAVHNDAGGC